MTSTKSATPGTNTSTVEVTNVSLHGFWLFLDGRELYVAFKLFPWFQDASIRELTSVKRPSRTHLYWSALDVDLAVESIEHPERYPLVSQQTPSRVREPTPRRSLKPKPARRTK